MRYQTRPWSLLTTNASPTFSIAVTLHGASQLTPLHVALGAQHIDDALRALVAEQLAKLLLVIGNAVRLNQRDKVVWRVAG